MSYPGFKFMKIDVGFEVDSLGETSELPQRDELSHTWNMILRDIEWDPQVHLKNITMIEGKSLFILMPFYSKQGSDRIDSF